MRKLVSALCVLHVWDQEALRKHSHKSWPVNALESIAFFIGYQGRTVSEITFERYGRSSQQPQTFPGHQHIKKVVVVQRTKVLVTCFALSACHLLMM